MGDSVQPEAKGVNLIVKCVKAPVAVEGSDGLKEVVCGDETGVVTVSHRSDTHEALCKPGAGIRIQNAHVRMVKGHIRLVVDKWSVLKTAESLEFETVDESKNVSDVEYELK